MAADPWGLEETEEYIPERIVHAKYNGVEVVRYDDEWFLEPIGKLVPSSSYGTEVVAKGKFVVDKKKKVSLEEAAQAAAEGVKHAWSPESRAWTGGFQIFWEQEGGEKFDEIVKKLAPMLYLEIKYADLGDGHTFMAMRCPGCREWMHIDNTQIRGGVCTDHTRSAGGCGFHGYVFGPNAGYICDLGDVLKKEFKK